MKFTIEWLGGATLRIKLGENTLYVDPLLSPKGQEFSFLGFNSTRTDEPHFNSEDLGAADLVLLTHKHEDHLDRPAIEALSSKSFFIYHRELKGILKKAGMERGKSLRPGKRFTWNGKDCSVEVEGVRTLHCENRIFSPLVSGGNGYALRLIQGEEEYRIYISGDSLIGFRQMKLIESMKPQLIVVNGGAAYPGDGFLKKLTGKLTCDKRDIQKLADTQSNSRILPIHWGSFSHYKESYSDMDYHRWDNIRLLDPGEVWEIQRF